MGTPLTAACNCASASAGSTPLFAKKNVEGAMTPKRRPRARAPSAPAKMRARRPRLTPPTTKMDRNGRAGDRTLKVVP